MRDSATMADINRDQSEEALQSRDERITARALEEAATYADDPDFTDMLSDAITGSLHDEIKRLWVDILETPANEPLKVREGLRGAVEELAVTHFWNKAEWLEGLE